MSLVASRTVQWKSTPPTLGEGSEFRAIRFMELMACHSAVLHTVQQSGFCVLSVSRTDARATTAHRPKRRDFLQSSSRNAVDNGCCYKMVRDGRARWWSNNSSNDFPALRSLDHFLASFSLAKTSPSIVTWSCYPSSSSILFSISFLLLDLFSGPYPSGCNENMHCYLPLLLWQLRIESRYTTQTQALYQMRNHNLLSGRL